MKVMKKNRRLSYKQVVYLCVMAAILLLLFIFVFYSYFSYLRECEAAAVREAENTAYKVVSQVDERFNILQQYYNTKVTEDDIKEVIENWIDYSYYKQITAARDAFACTTYLDNYVRGYTFINYRTGWIISSKGMFPISDAVNESDLEKYFQDTDSKRDQYYWVYDTSAPIENKIDRNYRTTLELDGLDYIMRLPHGYNSYAMLIVNVNLNTWKNWIRQSLGEGDQIVVLDENGGGGILYASSAALGQYLAEKVDGGAGIPEGKTEFQGEEYVIRADTSDILGWRYYVFHDISVEKGGFNLSLFWAVAILGMAFLVFILAAYTIYRPVGILLKDVSADIADIRDAPPAGNEMDILAGSIKSLRGDNELLQSMISQSRDRLLEMFELRLIKGEIRREEEWQEYIRDFGLERKRFYVTVVSILDLSEEEIQSNVQEDMICLKLVEGMPEEIKKMAWMPPVYNSYTICAIFSGDDENVLLENISAYYCAMQEYSQRVSDYKLLMGVSANHTEVRHLQTAYNESIKALTYPAALRGEAANGQMEAMENCHYYPASATVQYALNYDSSFEKEVQTGLKALDKSQCYKAVDGFCHGMRESKMPQYECMIFTIRFVNAILFTALETKVNLELIYPQGIRKLYSDLLDAFELSRTRRYIKMYFVDPILEARGELLNQMSYSMMEEIERMIEESKGDISLTQCAEALHVHPTYVWKVLKMEKGKSFSDYLEEYKLEEAKKLLLGTSLSVAEIAASLNYTNAQNFIRFFSKKVGVTPGKYRKLYG